MRECPICSARVHIIHEGDGIAAGGGGDLVAYYGEHDPCPGSYAPVDVPVVLEAPTFAAPIDPPKPPPVPYVERERHIVEYLTKHGPCTVGSMSRGLGVSDRVVDAVALSMLRRGALVRVGRRGRYRYAIPCPIGGAVAAEVWSALLSGPVEPFSVADELRRTPHGVRAVLGRLRVAGAVVQRAGRWEVSRG